MKQATSIITIALVLLSFNALCLANDYYVDAVNGDNSKTGAAQDQAWKTITYTILHAAASQGNPAVIHIAASTYNMALGETFPLTMDDDIQLIGDNKDTTIIDATGSSSSVIYSQYADNVKIEGLTITGGEGSLKTQGEIEAMLGGGFYLDTSSIDIDNCIIRENTAEMGGGISFAKSTLNLTNCEIRDNKAISPNEQATGGGIFGGATSGKIENCIISNNTANLGGGVSSRPLFPPIENCQIINNAVTRSDDMGTGGGIICTMSDFSINNSTISENKSNMGGGVVCLQASPDLKNCQIIGNFATSSNDMAGGGGIICMTKASPTIENCLIKENKSDYGGGIMYLDNSSPVVTNSTIENNKANKYGGAFYYESGSQSKIINCLILNNYGHEGGAIVSNNASPKFNLCTIAGNTGNYANGFYAVSGGKPTLTSSILWNNDVYPIRGAVTITYSDVEYGFDGEGNINQDPLFASGPWGDYYLSSMSSGDNADSPCIDAANELPIMGFNPKDYITRCDGVFDSGRVDMGYHYMPRMFSSGLR